MANLFAAVRNLFGLGNNNYKRRPGPWRQAPPFTPEYLVSLKERIENFSPPPALNISRAKILVIGMCGSGKSSIYNTVDSVFSGRITQKAICGSAVGSLTTTYRPYFVRGSTGTPLNFCLCDTCGLEVSQGPNLVELNYLLDGHVPIGYQFNPESPITPQVSGFIKRPNLEDRVHCVIFVIDSSTLDAAPKWFWERLNLLQVYMNKKGIPRAVFLTKIDKVSQTIADDVSIVFQSDDFKQKVTKVAEKLGMPENSILPIRNYYEETNLDEKINILALTALDHVLGFANDFFFGQLDLMEGSRRHTMDQLQLYFVIAVCILLIVLVGYFCLR